MAEQSIIVRDLMATDRFRVRVRAIVANKASSVLAEASPDADQLTWAKAAISSGYDCWVEALLILIETTPATIEAAMNATDAAYVSAFASVFEQAVKAKV